MREEKTCLKCDQWHNDECLIESQAVDRLADEASNDPLDHIKAAYFELLFELFEDDVSMTEIDEFYAAKCIFYMDKTDVGVM